tara:strand:+ start:217 stop:1326 length:1110 start_codon:yes stop_codon:yes gene_type:complete
MNTNFRKLTLTELKNICRNEPSKYRGFSSLKKSDLINFMYQKNSTNQRQQRSRPSYNLSDVSHIFETPDDLQERIESYQEERPDDSIIQDLLSGLKETFKDVSYTTHENSHNDMIYKATKSKYVEKYGSLGEHGEMILFHGTDKKNIDSILSDDFSLTNSSIHGALYGRGIYFTNDIKKAAHYSERGNRDKYILVCNVHVGDICQGYSTMTLHPKIRGTDKTYDTSVDNLENPKQFVKKKNGTYNILGIIKISNYYFSDNIRWSGSFTVMNFQEQHMSLYWVPPNVPQFPNIQIQKCKKLSEIVGSTKKFIKTPNGHIERVHPGVTKQKCQIGHSFILVAHYSSGWDPLSNNAIIRSFTSKGKSEIIEV